MALESRLKPTWDWVLNVMDATEAQLRFGASLTHSTDPSHPLHPLHLNSSAPPQATPSTATLSGLNVLGGSSQSRTRLIDSSNSGSRNILSGECERCHFELPKCQNLNSFFFQFSIQINCINLTIHIS